MSKITLVKYDIISNISVFLGFQKIYGIGAFFSLLICKKMGFNPTLKMFELLPEEISYLDFLIFNSLFVLRKLIRFSISAESCNVISESLTFSIFSCLERELISSS